MILHRTTPRRAMSRRTGKLPWLLLLLWSTWIFTFHGRFAVHGSWGAWAPDLGLLLVLSLDARVPRELAWRVAAVVALARIATSADPPLAIFVGYLGLVGFAGPLRELVLLDGPLARALFSALAALTLGCFLVLTQGALQPGVSYGAGFGPTAVESCWRSAVSTGVIALFFLPYLRGLPGLSPLLRTGR